MRPGKRMFSGGRAASENALKKLQRDTFGYFLAETNPANGLVPDSTRTGSPSSISAVGLALTAYPVGVEQGWLSREQGVQRTLTTLRFLWNSPQGKQPDATGYKGFFYHFLDMKTGRRAWRSELSTIDTTFLVAGCLATAVYFDRGNAREREIRELADALYRRVDWRWAQNRGRAVALAWKPESGFSRYRWQGYSEAILLYVLGLASPTHPLSRDSYEAWTRTYRWKKLYDVELLYAGPLFIHQLSHVWIDFRGIQDAFMRAKRIDYFENSRRATYAQRAYAIRNPREFRGYSQDSWGITASDGPGPAVRRIDGVVRRFYDFKARGVPWGQDDGTIAPWAAIASLPFAPEIVLAAIDHFQTAYPEMTSKYGFKCSFNPTFRARAGSRSGWISKGYYGIEQGPIVLMIENHLSGFVWRLMRECAYLPVGLEKAGYRGGWLRGPQGVGAEN